MTTQDQAPVPVAPVKKVRFGTAPENEGGGVVGLMQTALKTHVCVMGTTGSGKTGVLFNLQEEFVRNGVPQIVVDIKGDMSNILSQQDPAMAALMDVRILTPGGTHGIPVNTFGGLNRRDKVSSTISLILGMAKIDPSPLTSKPHAFLSKTCEVLMDHKCENIDLHRLIVACQTPIFADLGAMALDDVFPERSRTALAAKLNTIYAAPTFEHWRKGEDLNMDVALAPRIDGKVTITVYNVSHLSDDKDREFALGVLLTELKSWMSRQPGSADVKAAFFLDEAAGILPPYPRNPATKPPIMHMLKQGRAFGLCVVLASQNPMDFDYKAMGNCQTWIVGRLQTANDRKRVVEVIGKASSHDKCLLESRVGRLADREFMLVRPKNTRNFISRPVSTVMQGPLTVNEIKDMIKNAEDAKRAELAKAMAGVSKTWSF